MYDAAIIGTGPAGLSAAINLRLHEKQFIWFGSRDQSEKVSRSEKIANYLSSTYVFTLCTKTSFTHLIETCLTRA